MTRSYGWRPSLPDPRDLAGIAPSLKIPDTFSLRTQMPPVYDQGQLGSCTANAIAAALQYDKMLDGVEMGVPSRLFIYYCERVREATVQEDAGAYGRDGFASLRKTGAPPESEWPYVEDRFREKPPESAYTDAILHRIKNYVHPAKSKTAIQGFILNKQPVAFGFTVYESFESAKVAANGRVPMPDASEQVLGGHEVLAIGWDSYGLECRNSWSFDWGSDGYFWLPWPYVLNGYASDFRAIAR